MTLAHTVEHQRLAASAERRADWKQWGPYLSERAWGTVREDYSPFGTAWGYFPHDHARSRAYRWNEDGLGGFCNRFQNVCLAVALWNGQDAILKERLYGLTGEEGNHGEDVKEIYYYLDGIPSHAYMKMLYKYPQVVFPYSELVAENQRRGRDAPEYELMDAMRDAWQMGRYFDVFIEYAKASQEDILCRIRVVNRGPDPAPIHVLPQVWFRNTWAWGYDRGRPLMHAVQGGENFALVKLQEKHLGERLWAVQNPEAGEQATLLFTDNDTNNERLFGSPNTSPYVKDAFHRAIVNGEGDKVNPAQQGTKGAAHFFHTLEPGESFQVRVRFSPSLPDDPFADFEQVFDLRQQEADAFYTAIQPADLDAEARQIQRQALAGLLWSKQFYHYSVDLWLHGDPAQPPAPPERLMGRNADWMHLYNLDVISMPDKWEYPWYAAWDLAFHTLPLTLVDPEWAKRQLILLLREWYMHPNGQLPAYEWALGDVNPPVHAWAAWKVYQLDRQRTGRSDTLFLEKVFQKLMLNFTWWVNREDRDGNNVFQGGFLGLDNIGVFDRSKPLPVDGHIDQADGTAWMAMYSLNMMTIALELARTRPAYEDVASKFFEHFLYIAAAFYDMGGKGLRLWDDKDGFFYDALHTPDGNSMPLRVRSFVGLIPLFVVDALEPDLLERLPGFRRRVEWFLKYRPKMLECVASLTERGVHGHYQLAIVDRAKLQMILQRVFDPQEFLSPYGVRSLSRYHAEHPYELQLENATHTVRYEPAESTSGLFGGNSNWRGPVWFPVNYLLIDALRRFHHHYGDGFKVEVPLGSGNWCTLNQAADELGRRLVSIFRQDPALDGQRPVFGAEPLYRQDAHWRDHLLFYEYFHGDNGAGVGASHQTGWTALVANLINERT